MPTPREVADEARRLADWLDTHAEAISNLGDNFDLGIVDLRVTFFGYGPADEQKNLAAAFARMRRGARKTSKDANGSFFELRHEFGRFAKAEACLSRDQVCERRVVGKETIAVEDYSIERPKKLIEREIVEWECPPVLAAVERK